MTYGAAASATAKPAAIVQVQRIRPRHNRQVTAVLTIAAVSNSPVSFAYPAATTPTSAKASQKPRPVATSCHTPPEAADVAVVDT
jgi:hypothetical protein